MYLFCNPKAEQRAQSEDFAERALEQMTLNVLLQILIFILTCHATNGLPKNRK